MNQKDRLIAIVEDWEQVCANLNAEIKRLREQLTSADKMIREMIRESRDTPREAYVSGSAREAEQLFVHVLEANWDEVIE